MRTGIKEARPKPLLGTLWNGVQVSRGVTWSEVAPKLKAHVPCRPRSATPHRRLSGSSRTSASAWSSEMSGSLDPRPTWFTWKGEL